MQVTRRQFMHRSAAGLAGAALFPALSRAADASSKYRISACDWSLRAEGPEGLETAKTIGLDGLEISAGSPADTLTVADPAVRARYKELLASTGVVVSSVAMGLLNNAPLATDPRGPAWLEQTIEATQDLGAKVILLAFFGDGDLTQKAGLFGRGKLNMDAVDVVVERLKAAVPMARDAGVILGIENTLNAEENIMILERVGDPAVKVYYDVGNSTYNGYDIAAEIRLLGDKICQIHFKDGGFLLGKGKVDMDAAAAAIKDIGYEGWFVLETAARPNKRDEDFMENAAYLRNLFGVA